MTDAEPPHPPSGEPSPPVTHPWSAPQGNGAGGYVAAGSARPYPTAPVEHPQGNVVLLLGILGFVVPVVGPVAWYLGHRALREIRTSGLPHSNEQAIVVGRLLGLVVTLLLIVGVVFTFIALVVVGIMAYTFGNP